MSSQPRKIPGALPSPTYTNTKRQVATPPAFTPTSSIQKKSVKTVVVPAVYHPTAPNRHSTPTTVAVSSLVQRKIFLNDKSKKFGSNDARPEWRAGLKKKILDDLETKLGGKVTAGRGALEAAGYDRAHKISFSAIQRWVLHYLNETASDTTKFKSETASFQNKTDLLYRGKNTPEYKHMLRQRERLEYAIQNGDDVSTLKSAQSFLSLLNSATANVDLGLISVNRAQGDSLELNFATNSAGKLSMTPNSKKNAARPSDEVGEISYTPRKTSIISSLAPRGKVGKSEASPFTRKQLFPAKK